MCPINKERKDQGFGIRVCFDKPLKVPFWLELLDTCSNLLFHQALTMPGHS